ncbi:MAG: 2-oxo acid dehydrogenase subunit E2 [Caldilineaceae bacterium]
MATELKLPDLGEGVSDVTISRWRVKEGAKVNSGDVILEVATDKVDTEVPATADGVLVKINFKEGEMAPVDAVLGLIGEAGETVAAPGTRNEAAVAKTAGVKPDAQSETPTNQELAPNVNGNRAEAEMEVKASPVAQRIAADKGVDLGGVTGTGPGGRITKGDVLASTQQNNTPAVQSNLPAELADLPSLEVSRLAAQYNVDLRKVAKGRPLSTLNRYDVMSVIEGKTVAPDFAPPATEGTPSTLQSSASAAKDETIDASPAQSAATPTAQPKAEASVAIKAGEELVKHSRMRMAVAKNTAASAFTAPHVTTMWDVEMSAVLAHRAAHKAEFAKAGINLTVTPYLIEAILAGLKAVPAANATWTEEGVVIKRYYNVGMAVALPIDSMGWAD